MEASKWQKNAARKGVLEDPLSWQPGEHLYKICPGYMLVRQAAAQGICPVLGKEHVEKAREGNLSGWSQALLGAAGPAGVSRAGGSGEGMWTQDKERRASSLRGILRSGLGQTVKASLAGQMK